MLKKLCTLCVTFFYQAYENNILVTLEDDVSYTTGLVYKVFDRVDALQNAQTLFC